jgi:hypothetical protein
MRVFTEERKMFDATTMEAYIGEDDLFLWKASVQNMGDNGGTIIGMIFVGRDLCVQAVIGSGQTIEHLRGASNI